MKRWLILGHGKLYKDHDEYRCSPIDKELWINEEYTSVDMDENVEPDIMFDLRESKWTFAKDCEYDYIVDTTGLGLQSRMKSPECINEIHRILKIGGTFYGSRRQFIYTKTINYCE